MMSYNDIVVEISCSLYMHSTYDISGIQHYFALRLSRATTTPSWISFLVFRSSHALTFCSNKVRILCGTARPSTFVHSKLFGHKIAGTMTINRTDHHFVLHDKSLEWRWVSSKKENLWTSSPSWYATWCVNFHVLTSNTTGATGASPTHQKLGTTKSMDGCPLGPKHETRYKQVNVTAGNSCLVVGFAGHVICRHHKVCLQYIVESVPSLLLDMYYYTVWKRYSVWNSARLISILDFSDSNQVFISPNAQRSFRVEHD